MFRRVSEAHPVMAEECAPIVTALVRKPEASRDFMTRFIA